jgi:hypothetical protein
MVFKYNYRRAEPMFTDILFNKLQHFIQNSKILDTAKLIWRQGFNTQW